MVQGLGFFVFFFFKKKIFLLFFLSFYLIFFFFELRFFSFSLFFFCLRFFSFFEGSLHSGRSKVTRATVGRDTNQSFRVCNVHLATLKVATILKVAISEHTEERVERKENKDITGHGSNAAFTQDTNVPLVRIKNEQIDKTCIGRRTDSDQNMCKWISQVPQISRHRS